MNDSTHLLEPEDVMAFLDGELDRETAAVAAAHLRECGECQEIAAAVQSVSRQMETWQLERPEAPVSAAVAETLDKHLVTTAKRKTQPGSLWSRFLALPPVPRWMLGGAGALVVLMLFASQFPLMRLRNVEYGPAAPPSTSAQAVLRAPAPSIATSEMAERLPSGGNRDRLSIARNRQAIVAKEQAALSSSLQFSASEPQVQIDTGNAPRSGTMIARTAQLTITVKDFAGSQARLEEILQRHGGYIGDLTSNAPEGSARTFSATLRVPADQLDAAMVEIKQLGRVESESQNGEEVTSQYVDLEARLGNARNTEQRLNDLLRRQAGKLSEVVELEEKISEVRQNIEQMEAEKKSLLKRVAFGTLTIVLNEEHKAQLQIVPPSIGTQFHNAAVDGYRSVVSDVVGIVTFLMSWGPSLLLWFAILFFPARYAWRKMHRAE